MKKIFLAVIILIVFCIGQASTVSAVSTPIESIRSTVDGILNTMRDPAFSDPARVEERRNKISKLIRERFDFLEMSKRSLAKYWKPLVLEERKEFVQLFSDLLEASYIGKIESYTDEKITYDSESIKQEDKYGVVNTTIKTASVDIPIEYKLINRTGEWLVYDVVIEGVSFISTYRSQYAKIIRKEQFAGLINKMKEKLSEVNATP
ncbi:MAG: ABC transporter substrate-binding protein [Nitrospira sp.]|nr:ABC transporter substrate-binding protein [bacterium]MBL7048867.1 ABC transporter substrate-binding protein [Nitrospira sp.]